MKEYYNHPEYIIEDTRKISSILSRREKLPDLIITSPPYFDLLNYENNSLQIGFGQTYEEYIDALCNVFQTTYEYSNPTATFWLIIDTFKKGGETKTLPFDIHNALKQKYSKTWILKEIIIWDKDKNIPWNSNGRFKNQYEFVLFFSKTDKFTFNIDEVREINDLKKWWKTYPERYNPNGKAPTNIWNYITPIRGWGNGTLNHLCPFPFPLIEKIISICSNENDIVFDPFAGSGTVLALSMVMGRYSFGVDINDKYKTLFENEALIAAKKYWNERKKEIETNYKEISDFKNLNLKLRKQKVSSNIISCLKEENKADYLGIVLSSSDSKEIRILLNSNKTKKDIIYNEKVRKLIMQAKVNPIIEHHSLEELKKILNKKKLYKYTFEKFNSYSNKTNIYLILKSKSKYDFFYSDIEVKLI